MKKTLLNAALLTAFSAAAILPLSVSAATPNTSSGTINISGQVVSSTCTVSVNGNGASPTVTLPTVDTGTLATANSTAGWTAVKVALSGCTAVTGKTTVLPNFELGANTDTANGYLKNTATGGAGNVEVVLSNDQTLANSVKLNQAAGNQNAGTAATITTNPTFTYYAAYVATAAATAGAVTTSVQYDLSYQ